MVARMRIDEFHPFIRLEQPLYFRGLHRVLYELSGDIHTFRRPPMQPGLFRLRTAADLLAKLRHDRKRVQANPLDEYAAFDFFVTANHMPEWLHPNDGATRKAMRDASALLQICDHIASGAKHFAATHPKHQSVDDTGYHHGKFTNDFSRMFDIERISIFLTPTAATALAAETGEYDQQEIEASDLAERVMKYWEREMA